MRDFTQRDIKQLVDEKVLNGKPFEENGYVFGYHGQMKPYTTYKNYPKNMLDPVFWENAKFSNNYLDPELQKFILSFFDKAEDLVMFHELMDSKFRLIHKAIYEHCIEGVPDYSLTFVDFVADQSVFMEHRAIVPEYKLEDLKKLKKYDFELTEYIFLKQYESCKNAEATKF
jgi:hypothetical protein